jgi:hypothetical protein
MRRFQGFILPSIGIALVVGACGSSSGTNSGADTMAVPGAGGTGTGSGTSSNNAGGSAAANTGTAGDTSGTAGAGATDSSGGDTSISEGTGGASPGCGTDTCGTDKCGQYLDPCDGSLTVDCGYGNCVNGSQALCVNNVCQPCTPLDTTTADCAGANNGGVQRCGPIDDTCGGFVQCGDCPSGQCCGCNGAGPSNCGTSSSGNGTGLAQTCIVGTQGCLCDALGQCAPGLDCVLQTSGISNGKYICCTGSDCSAPNNAVGASCGVPDPSQIGTCTPGVTILTGNSTTDSCGYPASSFGENGAMSQYGQTQPVICGINAVGGGTDPAVIQAYFNDEMALTLGCATSTYPVTPLTTSPQTTYYPQTGDPACVDTVGRFMRPALYITDITSAPNCLAGDQQNGGPAYDPIAIFGTWKSATMASNNVGTPNAGNPAKNYFTLGTGSDPVPQSVFDICPCYDAQNCNRASPAGMGYGAETRYSMGLISGHEYRLQVIMHDGDQNQGGDSGEYCALFCAGTGSPCVPLTCDDYPASCGQQPDGCGGLTPVCDNCPNPCPIPTCEDVCTSLGISCQTNNDPSTGYVVSCFQPDQCNGLLQCWCLVG